MTIKNLKVNNKGWEVSQLSEDAKGVALPIQIRGYEIIKNEQTELISE